MTLFKGLLRALSAALSAGAVAGLHGLIAWAQTFMPSDIATTLWVVLSMGLVFVLNYLVGEFGPKASS